MKASKVMQRSKFTKINEKMVLLHDLTSLTLEDAIKVVKYCSSIIEAIPNKTVLALTIMDEVTSSVLNEDMLGQFCGVLEKNREKINKSAFVCPDGRLKRFFTKAAADAGRTNVGVYYDKEEAIQWLTT